MAMCDKYKPMVMIKANKNIWGHVGENCPSNMKEKNCKWSSKNFLEIFAWLHFIPRGLIVIWRA